MTINNWKSIKKHGIVNDLVIATELVSDRPLKYVIGNITYRCDGEFVCITRDTHKPCYVTHYIKISDLQYPKEESQIEEPLYTLGLSVSDNKDVKVEDVEVSIIAESRLTGNKRYIDNLNGLDSILGLEGELEDSFSGFKVSKVEVEEVKNLLVTEYKAIEKLIERDRQEDHFTGMIGMPPSTKTILTPKEGWHSHTYYWVLASFSPDNPLHLYLFFTGFINEEGAPSGYNQFVGCEDNTMYHQAHYLQVVSKVARPSVQEVEDAFFDTPTANPTGVTGDS